MYIPYSFGQSLGHSVKKRKETKTLRFSAIITGASQGGSPEHSVRTLTNDSLPAYSLLTPACFRFHSGVMHAQLTQSP